MTQPPNIKIHVVSPEKMKELFDQHTFQQKLLQCRPECTTQSQGNYWLDSLEKKELTRYIDPATEDEILLIAEYTYTDPQKEKVRILLRLRIENDLYSLRLL
jgi:hypothetical protein